MFLEILITICFVCVSAVVGIVYNVYKNTKKMIIESVKRNHQLKKFLTAINDTHAALIQDMVVVKRELAQVKNSQINLTRK